MDPDQQRKQYCSSIAKFTRLLWSLDWETSLTNLLTQPTAVSALGQWLTKRVPADAVQLEVVVIMGQLRRMPAEEGRKAAVTACHKYIDETERDGEQALMVSLMA